MLIPNEKVFQLTRLMYLIIIVMCCGILLLFLDVVKFNFS